MLNRIKALAKKEIKQLLRDPRMMFVILFFPVFLLVIFGYAVNFDVKHVQLGIYDQDNSMESRKLIEELTSSEYFDISIILNSSSDVTNAIERKEAQCVLVIPADYSRNLFRNEETSKLQFLIDGVDGNTAAIVQNYTTMAVAKFNSDKRAEFASLHGVDVNLPVNVEPVFWFNPELKSTYYLLPGLIAMILIITAVVSVSLTLVREKEKGTIEQINVSAITTIELLIGKSIPFIIISLIDSFLILLAGYILFDIVVTGSYLLLFTTILIFVIASISIGIFVSVLSDSQQIAFTVSTFMTMLPSIILSGFIFPIDSMPPVIQLFTNITPAKFFLTSLRGVMLKGVSFYELWDQWLYMSIFVVVFLTLATLINKKKSGLN